MLKKYILAIDQGTTGSRAFIFDSNGQIVSSDYLEFKQYFPKPGWVEHDAEEIWASCVKVIKGAIIKANISAQNILAIGITNQRETIVAWDRTTSKPIYHAIVWQCRRTAPMCGDKRYKQYESIIRHKTGLVLDPYFSATKIKWMLDHIPGLESKVTQGKICFGTIDSWLIWKLSGGKAHVTDTTNASRTLLYNIRRFEWDQELLKIFSVPPSSLPDVKNSGSTFAKTNNRSTSLPNNIPIAAVMGDQQAALYGQRCYQSGSIKNTYGTGCFLVLNTGKKLILSKKGLISTIACDIKGQPVYAMEGSIFMAGALIQWLRDELKIIKSSTETEKIIQGLPDTNGVYIVPAFTGLGAPYWDSTARGTITGLTRGANARHLVRASLEAIAYQTKDVFDLMQEEYGQKIPELKVDGGACRNNFLMQFQADMLACRIIRPKVIETTAQGAAHLAGMTVGLWDPARDLKNLHTDDQIFSPKFNVLKRKLFYSGWQKAVQQTISC